MDFVHVLIVFVFVNVYTSALSFSNISASIGGWVSMSTPSFSSPSSGSDSVSGFEDMLVLTTESETFGAPSFTLLLGGLHPTYNLTSSNIDYLRSTNDVWSVSYAYSSSSGLVGQWTLLGSAPFSPRWQLAGVIFNNFTNFSSPSSSSSSSSSSSTTTTVFVFAGLTGASANCLNDVWSTPLTTFQSVQAFTSGIWTQSVAPFSPRGGLSVVMFLNKIFIAGGGCSATGSVFDIWSYDPSLSNWTSILPNVYDYTHPNIAFARPLLSVLHSLLYVTSAPPNASYTLISGDGSNFIVATGVPYVQSVMYGATGGWGMTAYAQVVVHNTIAVVGGVPIGAYAEYAAMAITPGLSVDIRSLPPCSLYTLWQCAIHPLLWNTVNVPWAGRAYIGAAYISASSSAGFLSIFGGSSGEGGPILPPPPPPPSPFSSVSYSHIDGLNWVYVVQGCVMYNECTMKGATCVQLSFEEYGCVMNVIANSLTVNGTGTGEGSRVRLDYAKGNVVQFQVRQGDIPFQAYFTSNATSTPITLPCNFGPNHGSLFPAALILRSLSLALVNCTLPYSLGPSYYLSLLYVYGGVQVVFDTSEVFDFSPPTITPQTLQLLIQGSAPTVALNAPLVPVPVMFRGVNLYSVLAASTIHVWFSSAQSPNVWFNCPVSNDASDPLGNFIVCLPEAVNGGIGFTFTVETNGVNVTGTDTYNVAIPPSLVAVHGCSVNDTSFASSCPTAGGVPLTIDGCAFVPPITADIGGNTASCSLPFPSSSTSLSLLSSGCASLPLQSVLCTLPPGAGSRLAVTLSSSQSRLRSAPTSVAYVSYQAPIVNKIGSGSEGGGCVQVNDGMALQMCERSGNVQITLYGHEFGGNGSQVYIGSNICTNVVHSSSLPDSVVSCILPPGKGVDRPVFFLQQNGLLNVGAVTVSYAPCPAGTIETTDASLTCLPCQSGFNSTSGSYSCSPLCPSSNLYYSNGICNLCIPTTTCTTLASLPSISPSSSSTLPFSSVVIVSKAGYYHISSSSSSSSSIDAFVCQQNDCVDALSASLSLNCSQQFSSYSTATSTSLSSTSSSGYVLLSCCAENRMPANVNVLCARCMSGYIKSSGSCVACTSPNSGLLFLFLVLSFLYVLGFHVASQTTSANIKIILYYLQTTQLFFGPDVSFISWLSFFGFAINFSSTGYCVLPLTPLQTVLMGLILPAICTALFLVIVVVHFLMWLVASSSYKSSASMPPSSQSSNDRLDIIQTSSSPSSSSSSSISSSLSPSSSSFVQPLSSSSFSSAVYLSPFTENWRWQPFVRTACALALFTYNSITTTVLSLLDTMQVGNVVVVTSEYAIHTDDDDYQHIKPLIYVLLVFVVIGFPLALLSLLFVLHRKQLLEHDRTKALIGIVYEGYVPAYFFWEVVILVRRVLLISIIISFSNNTVVRFSWLSFVNVFIVIVTIYTHPYISSPSFMLDLLSLSTLTLLTILLSQSSTWPLSLSSTSASTSAYTSSSPSSSSSSSSSSFTLGLGLALLVFGCGLVLLLIAGHDAFKRIYVNIKRTKSTQNNHTQNRNGKLERDTDIDTDRRDVHRSEASGDHELKVDTGTVEMQAQSPSTNKERDHSPLLVSTNSPLQIK